jgi:hypothetical protein
LDAIAPDSNDYDAEPGTCKILLMLKVAIGGDESLETLAGCPSKQLTVLQPAPIQIRDVQDLVFWNFSLPWPRE